MDIFKKQALQDKINAMRNDPALKKTLLDIDYIEPPVDLETFIKDPHYLGNSTENGAAVYDYWKDTLKEVFDDDKLFEAILSGAIGTGKSSTAIIGAAYVLHRLLCLKNPYKYYKHLVGKPFTFVFFSLTLSLTKASNFQAFQNMIQLSPWFKARGKMRGTVDRYLAFDNVSYALGSPRAAGFGNIGTDVVCAILDELNAPGEPLSIKQKMYDAYTGVLRRLETRFMEEKRDMRGFKLFMCASKEETLSFIEQHIEDRRESKNSLIKEPPFWITKPSIYSGETFQVAVGDQYKDSRVLNGTPADAEAATKEGMQVLDVPVEHKDAFETDIVGALRDIAGISVKSKRKFKLIPSESYIKASYKDFLGHPFTVKELELGLMDDIKLIELFNADTLREIDAERCAHVDIGVTGDALGIAMGHCEGFTYKKSLSKSGNIVQVKLPVIVVDFILRIKAKESDEIPINKVAEFFMDLVALGLTIKKVTFDRYQSTSIIQMLKQAGIDSVLKSVDIDDGAYIALRTAMLDKRLWMYEYTTLEEELSVLEWDRTSRKVDHPAFGSKDCADAVAGMIDDLLETVRVDSLSELVAELGIREANKQEEQGDNIKDMAMLIAGVNVHKDNPGINRQDKTGEQDFNTAKKMKIEGLEDAGWLL